MVESLQFKNKNQVESNKWPRSEGGNSPLSLEDSIAGIESPIDSVIFPGQRELSEMAHFAFPISYGSGRSISNEIDYQQRNVSPVPSSGDDSG